MTLRSKLIFLSRDNHLSGALPYYTLVRQMEKAARELAEEGYGGALHLDIQTLNGRVSMYLYGAENSAYQTAVTVSPTEVT